MSSKIEKNLQLSESGKIEKLEQKHNFETELKVIDLPNDFIERLSVCGAKLVSDRVLLHELRFDIPKESRKIDAPKKLTLNLSDFKDIAGLKSALSLLGLTAEAEVDGRLVLERPAEIPNRAARLRRFNGEIIFTVKDRRKDNRLEDSKTGIVFDRRREAEVAVGDEKELRRLLDEIGYALDSEREKLRTTFNLNGVSVEINELPLQARVPAYAEFEFYNPRAIIDILRKLGISKEQTATISEKKYMKMRGAPDDLSRHVLFDKAYLEKIKGVSYENSVRQKSNVEKFAYRTNRA